MTIVETRLGKVQGKQLDRVLAFMGIRYGRAPLGTYRFKPSIAVGQLTSRPDDAYDATRPRHSAVQNPPVEAFVTDSRKIDTNPTFSEDCLFLNIYTPAADGKHRPVLYWIHGGSYVSGSSYDYDGRVLAEQGDVVVVTVNYRLGLLGFLDMSGFGDDYKGSASNGISDQILGLEWVRDNIADYGGDAGNVTLFGQSAGAGSVNGILAAPRADGLYHRAIAHSGSAAASPPAPIAQDLANHLAIDLAELPAKLDGMGAEDILGLQNATSLTGGLCVDGTVITRPTLDAIAQRGAHGIPYIAGSNANEGSLFTFFIPEGEQDLDNFKTLIGTLVMDGADPQAYLSALSAHYKDQTPKAQFEQVWNDLFRRASINLAAAATAAGPGGWLYRFDLPTNVVDGKLGATHGAEIPFTFNTFADPEAGGVVMHDRQDARVRRLAQLWSQTILNFARTGDPNDGGLPNWPKFETDSRQSLVLDANSWIADAGLDHIHTQLWEEAG